MIYQVQETCKSIYDYWLKHKYYIFFTKKLVPFLWTYMWILHNLVNGPQRLTSSKPNPKMQHPNMIYQMQKTCKSRPIWL
jgi:hypothetical protein